MNISNDMIIQICSFVGTIIAVVWYISNTLSDIKRQLSNAEQLNTVQDKQLDQVHNAVVACSNHCKEGRVKIWEEVNNMKVQVAKLEATKDRDK